MKTASPAIEPLLVDEKTGAAMCGVSYWVFRSWTAQRLIPLVTPPSALNPRRTIRRKLVDVADIKAFIATHKQGGGR